MVEVDLSEVKEVLLIVRSKALERYYEKRRRVRALFGEEVARPVRRRRAAVVARPGPAIDLWLGPSGDIPWDVRSRIEGLGGSRILLVYEKVVIESDVRKSQQRLLMPPSTIWSPSFPRGSCSRPGQGRTWPRFRTTFETHEVSLRRWEMRKGEDNSSTVCYVLTGRWNQVVVRNRFRKVDLLQVWSFWVEARLQLALFTAHNYER